jgi:GMP synthase-like glutamine amidotransferase
MTEVTADIEWINELKDFISEIIDRNQGAQTQVQPIFGICFGAQIIAECRYHGSVTFLEDPEFGISRIKLTDSSHRLFKGMASQFDAYSFHYNQIWSDEVYAISTHNYMDHEFLQAFEVPSASVFGVQFHPEFKHDQMIRLFEMYKDLISDFGFDLQPIIETLPKLEGNAILLKNFFDGYC